MKILGAHCYLGGFLLGLEQIKRNRIIYSLETWNKGKEAARIIGLPSIDYNSNNLKKITKVDLVVGNPPCSRFSHLSLSFFDETDHKEVETFKELLDLKDLALNTDARAIWWETGPLAYTVGEPLLINYHKYLQDKLGEQLTTLVYRIDLRYLGIPQRRPRNHIIHIRKKLKKDDLPKLPKIQWPPVSNIKTWIDDRIKDYKLENPIYPSKYDGSDPVAWAKKQDEEMTFRSMVPKVFSESKLYTLSVLTSRPFIWKEENRFFDMLEYAALMTYPLDRILNLNRNLSKVNKVQKFLSKSVAPEITKWVYKQIVEPILMEQDVLEDKSRHNYNKVANGVWKVDLTIPNKMDRLARSGQLKLRES